MLRYFECGLSMADILLLQALFAIILSLCEVPSGYVADMLGRRKSLIAGSHILFIGTIIFALASTFSGFLLGEILFGIGLSLISGADQALLYDTMIAMAREAEFQRVWGRISQAELVGDALFLLLGGWYAAYSTQGPMIVSATLILLLVISATTLVEPPRALFMPKRSHLVEIGSLALDCLMRKQKLSRIILSSSLLQGAGITLFWLTQPFLGSHGLVGLGLGLVLAALPIWASLVARNTHRLKGKVSIETLLAWLSLITGVSLFVLGTVNSAWLIVLLLSNSTARGVTSVAVSDAINVEVSSELRATAISLSSLCSRITSSALMLSLGAVSSTENPAGSIAQLGVVILIGAGVLACIRAGQNRKCAV